MRVCNVVQRLEWQADELEITGSNPLQSIPFSFFFVRIIEVRISEGLLYFLSSHHEAESTVHSIADLVFLFVAK